MDGNPNIHELEQRRGRVRAELAAVGDFRRGTLREFRRKCGKPGCHCALDGDPGHGGWKLVRAVSGGGKVNRGIPASALGRTREQLAEYQRFRRLAAELEEVNEALCHARLATRRLAGRDPEKGGFPRS